MDQRQRKVSEQRADKACATKRSLGAKGTGSLLALVSVGRSVGRRARVPLCLREQFVPSERKSLHLTAVWLVPTGHDHLQHFSKTNRLAGGETPSW